MWEVSLVTADQFAMKLLTLIFFLNTTIKIDSTSQHPLGSYNSNGLTLPVLH